MRGQVPDSITVNDRRWEIEEWDGERESALPWRRSIATGRAHRIRLERARMRGRRRWHTTPCGPHEADC